MRDKYEMGFTGSSDNPEGERAIWKKIWSVSVPSKVKVFTWKVVRNGLPTRLNKKYRHLEEESSCQLCGHPEEDRFHVIYLLPACESFTRRTEETLSSTGRGAPEKSWTRVAASNSQQV
jgi:hypothetical protein